MDNHVLTTLEPDPTIWLDNFISVYQKLTTTNLDLLSNIYHKNVTFIDPMHQVNGFDNLYLYFNRLYQNLSHCTFIIENCILENDEAAVYWQMTYQHPKLNKGHVITIQGSSHIKGKDNKIIYQRDYIDLGAMLYEQLPFFGKVVTWFKNKAAR